MFASIRFRIVAAFLAGMLVMLAAMGVLVFQVQGVARSQALITDGYLPLAKTTALLTTWQARIDNDVRRVLDDEARPGTGALSPTVIFTDKLRGELQLARAHASASKGLATSAQQSAGLAKVLIQLGRIEKLFDDYRDQTARALAAAPGSVDRAALQQKSAALGDAIQTLSQEIDGRIRELTAQTEAARVQSTVVAAVLSAVAFLLAFALLGIVMYALRPIGRLTDQVQRLSAGDYTGRVEVRGADEIASLAAEFNTMVGAIRARDHALVERAEQLNTLSRYLASVVDSLSEGLVVLEDDAVTLTNPSARESWGVDRGAPIPELLAPCLAPGLHEITDADGRLHEVRVTAFGEAGWVLSTTDVTEATAAKQRLARSERLALVGQMLAQITHEVRNPLNALSLNTEMLADELQVFDPDKQTETWEILDTISGEIERLTDVTAHYLQLARRPPAQPEGVDLGHLVRDIERLLQPELKVQKVALTVRLGMVEPLHADGNQLRQALLNVVRNAVEAGARNLELTAGIEDHEVTLCLADDGPGMSEDELLHATDPFYSTKASGTGLGLAITRQILEDHDGVVRVQSTPGQGTRIELIFPHRKASA